MQPMTMFLLLCFAHALADFPLQGDYLAKAKNQCSPLPGTPWSIALTAHAAIQAGFVGIITGSVFFALAEFVAHWLIDFGKSAGRYSYATDQGLHVVCKATWCAMLWALH